MRTLGAFHDAPDASGRDSTWIVALDRRSGELGAAVASQSFSIG